MENPHIVLLPNLPRYKYYKMGAEDVVRMLELGYK
jgi:hypothetical protein